MQRRLSVGRLSLAILPLLIGAVFWRRYPILLIDADTPRYLANDPMRTATYPLFLDLFSGPALLPFQLGMFAAALSWLAIYSARFLPIWMSALLVLAIGANPYLWELQATIMSEALTTPLLTLLVGTTLGFAFTSRPTLLLASALLCGIMATIRPPCAALIAAPIVAALVHPGLQRRLRVRLLIAAVAMFAAPVAVERIYSRTVHGRELASPIPRHAFMKAAVIDAPPTALASSDPLDRRILWALNQGYAPVRELIGRAPTWQVRYALLTNYEACAAWGCGESMLKDVNRPRSDIDRALLKAGTARLASNPTAYLELSATEYLRMWLLHPRKHPGLAPGYNAFLAGEAPLPFQAQLGVEGQPVPPDEQQPIFRLNRAVFAGVGILAALLTVVGTALHRRALNRLSLPLLFGGQAVLALSAFTAVGLPRYAMGMWPAIVAGILAGALGLAGFKPLGPNRPEEEYDR